MVNKTKKVVFILIITFLLVNIFNVVLAINPNDYKPDNPTTNEAKEVVPKVGVILGAVRNISTIVAVIALMIIGFKYIIGSAEEKANYKATMIPYIIGCVLAVAGTTIVSFIYNLVH